MRKVGIVLVCMLVVTGMFFLAGCPKKTWSVKAVADKAELTWVDAATDLVSVITITNDGKAAMDWTAKLDTAAPAWVKIDKASGTNLAAAATAKVTVTATAADVTDGTTEVTVTIAGANVAKKTDPATPVLSVPVKIKITKAAEGEGEGEAEGEGEGEGE